MKNSNLESNLKIYYKLIGFSLLIILGVMALSHIIFKDNSYSEAEKRNLASAPKLSWNNIKEGKFSSDIEKYLTDQVPYRDNWISLNTSWNRFTGQNLSKGVYKGKGGYLIQRFEKPSKVNETETSQSLNKFLNKYPDCQSYIMLVPTGSEILNSYLPKAALTDSQKDWYSKNKEVFQGEQIHQIDLFKYFEEKVESNSLYYRTDHHWTSDGAFLGFQKLADKMALGASENDWEKMKICDTFQGTLMSKSGFYSSVMDEINIYTYSKKDIITIVNYEKERKTTVSIYDEEGLRGKNPYEVFLGGNHPKINIKTNADSQKKLLLLKDSYANCLIPFLLPYFFEIDVIDARYYAEDIYQQINYSNYTDILVLYNIETYSNDNALKKVLEEDMESE